MKDPIMKTIAIKALAAATLSILAVAPAAAEEARVTVTYGDLDIASPAGAETLVHRLHKGVEAACGRVESRDLKVMAAQAACKDAAMTDAVAQLSEKGAQVAALY
jgi:UrcA family protein